jgi:hypothetical protein
MKTRAFRIISVTARVIPLAALACFAQTAAVALADGPRIL